MEMLAPPAPSIAKTTPAPWETNESGYAIYTRGHRLIANVEVSAEGRANAKLISVAPEMKDTLEVVEDFLNGFPENGTEIDAAARLLGRVRDVLQRSEWP